jgi:uncharacterized membrane protein (UPF0127 family)
MEEPLLAPGRWCRLLLPVALAALPSLTLSGPWADPPEIAARAVLPSGRILTLEVADDPRERWTGLRGRAALPEGHGMLFVFPADEIHSFVMEDCLIPLDLLWLDPSGRVLHVEAGLEPCPEDAEVCPTWTSPMPARFVLELAAGSATEEKLAAGSLILLDLGRGALP